MVNPPPKPPADIDSRDRDYDAAFCVEQGDGAFFGGDIKLALRWYTRAIDKDPRSPRPWVMMLHVLIFKGNLAEFAAWVHRGMTLFPDSFELKALSAVQEARRGMAAQALADSQEVIQRKPNLAMGRLCRGEVLMVTGDRRFDHEFRAGLDMVPRQDWKTPLIIGMILMNGGHHNRALEYFNEAQRRNQEAPEIWYQIALCHAAKGRRLPMKHAIEQVRLLCSETDSLLTRLVHIRSGGPFRWLSGLFK